MTFTTRSNRIISISNSNVYRVDFAGQGSAPLAQKKDGLSKLILTCFDRLSIAITNTLDISGCLIYLRHGESYLVLASSNAAPDVKSRVPFIGNLSADGSDAIDDRTCPLSHPASIFRDAEKLFLIESDRVAEDTSVGLLVASYLETDQLTNVDTQFCEAMLGLVRRVFRFQEHLHESDPSPFDHCQEIEDIGILTAFGIRLSCQVNKVALFSECLQTDKYFASCGLEEEKAPSAQSMRFLGNQFVDFFKWESDFLEPVLGQELVSQKYICAMPFNPNAPSFGYLAITKDKMAEELTINDIIVCKGILSPLAHVLQLYSEHCKWRDVPGGPEK